jgi:hypothetical protein
MFQRLSVPAITVAVDSYVSQRAELVLVTGSGAQERFAGYGRHVSDTRIRFLVPDWVDPDPPAQGDPTSPPSPAGPSNAAASPATAVPGDASYPG